MAKVGNRYLSGYTTRKRRAANEATTRNIGRKGMKETEVRRRDLNLGKSHVLSPGAASIMMTCYIQLIRVPHPSDFFVISELKRGKVQFQSINKLSYFREKTLRGSGSVCALSFSDLGWYLEFFLLLDQ